jgi:hypothetical protein
MPAPTAPPKPSRRHHGSELVTAGAGTDTQRAVWGRTFLSVHVERSSTN